LSYFSIMIPGLAPIFKFCSLSPKASLSLSQFLFTLVELLDFCQVLLVSSLAVSILDLTTPLQALFSQVLIMNLTSWTVLDLFFWPSASAWRPCGFYGS